MDKSHINYVIWYSLVWPPEGQGANARDAQRLLEQHLPIKITIFTVLLLHDHPDLQAGFAALLTP